MAAVAFALEGSNGEADHASYADIPSSSNYQNLRVQYCTNVHSGTAYVCYVTYNYTEHISSGSRREQTSGWRRGPQITQKTTPLGEIYSEVARSTNRHSGIGDSVLSVGRKGTESTRSGASRTRGADAGERLCMPQSRHDAIKTSAIRQSS